MVTEETIKMKKIVCFHVKKMEFYVRYVMHENGIFVS